MRIKSKIAACPRCGQAVLVRCQTPCHAAHLALGLATQGMWLAVWLLLVIRASLCRCCLCGGPVWLAAPRPLDRPPPSARPRLDRQNGRCPRNPQDRFGAFLVESGLVYYAPTGR